MRVWMVLGIGLGCSGQGKSPASVEQGATADDDTAVGGHDSAVSSDGGSDADDGGEDETVTVTADDITAVVSEHVHTVVTVTWTTESETQGYLEFGETDAYGMRSPLAEVGSTAHEALMLGLWADTEFHFRVISVADDGTETASDDHTVTTLSLPTGMPTLTATGEAKFEGWVLVPFGGTSYLTAIVDMAGHYVWYKIFESDTHVVMRAVLDPDGSGVIMCMAVAGEDKEDAYLLKVSMDGATETEIAAPWLDHDAAVLPDGTIGGIVLETHGDRIADGIQEIAADGTMTQIWSAWDHIDWLVHADDIKPSGNWTHANALDYSVEEDAYYLAMRELSTTLKIDRSTGEVLWAMGGYANQFEWGAETEPLSVHHQFDRTGEHTMLWFENGEADRGYSRALELELDLDAMTATEVWSYTRDPSVFVFAKGDVDRFDGGSTLVTWSSSGELQEVDADGEVLWQLNSDLGSALTFVAAVQSLYGE